MHKLCSKCGKIHDINYQCQRRADEDREERRLRRSSRWTKRSREIREESHYLCQICLDRGVITYEDVEVHHIDKLRDRPDLMTDANNLVCLCREHHKRADAGVYSKEYLRKLAERRG